MLVSPVLQCPKNCAVCTSNVKCTTCLEGFNLNTEDMKCVAPVPAPAPPRFLPLVPVGAWVLFFFVGGVIGVLV